MNAEFVTDTGAKFRVQCGPNTQAPDSSRVWLMAVFPDMANAYQSPLTKSEARAIASALMGAAAEL